MLRLKKVNAENVLKDNEGDRGNIVTTNKECACKTNNA